MPTKEWSHTCTSADSGCCCAVIATELKEVFPEYLSDARHCALHSARLISCFPHSNGKMKDDVTSPVFTRRKPRLRSRSNCLASSTQLPTVEQPSHTAISLPEPASNHYVLSHSKTFCISMNWFGPSTPEAVGTSLMCFFWGGNLFL